MARRADATRRDPVVPSGRQSSDLGAEDPTRPALTCDEQVTHAELHRRASQPARELQDAGVSNDFVRRAALQAKRIAG